MNVTKVLKMRECSELPSAQYLARCLAPENVRHSITTRYSPKRRMNETLFTSHRNTVELFMMANGRKITLQAIHTDVVIKATNRQERKLMLDDRPPQSTTQKGT